MDILESKHCVSDFLPPTFWLKLKWAVYTLWWVTHYSLHLDWLTGWTFLLRGFYYWAFSCSSSFRDRAPIIYWRSPISEIPYISYSTSLCWCMGIKTPSRQVGPRWRSRNLIISLPSPLALAHLPLTTIHHQLPLPTRAPCGGLTLSSISLQVPRCYNHLPWFKPFFCFCFWPLVLFT